MRLKPTKGTTWLLAGLLILVVAIASGLCYMQSGALAGTLQVLQRKEAEVRDGKRVSERKEEAAQLLETDRAQLRYLESGVSDAVYVPTLLKQLEELARTTKNLVISVRPEVVVEAPTRLQQRRDPEAQSKGEKKDKKGEEPKKKKVEPYTPLAVVVTMIGNFRSTQEFLQRLQQFPKIMTLQQARLAPAQSGRLRDGQVALAVEMKLIAYIMKEEAPATSAVTAMASTGGTR